MLLKHTETSSFMAGKGLRAVMLATGLTFVATEAARAAPTRAECLEKAQVTYDNAVQACRHWSSDQDPYITCLNDAAYAYQSARDKCQKIVSRPPALQRIDRPTRNAPSR